MILKLAKVWLRFFLVFGVIAIASIRMLIKAIVTSREDLNLNADTANFMGKWGLKVLGIRLISPSFEQIHSIQPCIYVANHQSMLDVLTFGAVFPKKTLVVGKKELKWVPFFNLALWLGKNYFLNRENKTQAFAALREVGQRLKNQKASLLIFPEGTRNRTGVGILPLKKGAFVLGIETGLPLVPLVCSPVRDLIDLKRGVLKNDKPIKIYQLDPILTQGKTLTDISDMVKEVRERMLKKFVELGGRASIFLVYILGSSFLFLQGCVGSLRREPEPALFLKNLLPSTVQVRRTLLNPEEETIGGNPKGFACESLSEFLKKSIKEPESLRQCLNAQTEMGYVSYRLRRKSLPVYELNDLKKAPDCVQKLLPKLDVPREIFFQSKPEGVLQCYSSRLDLHSDEWLGAKVPKNQVDLKIDFPLEAPLKNDGELWRTLSSWLLSAFWSNAKDKRLGFPSQHVSNTLCQECLQGHFLDRDHPPEQSWP